MFQRLKSFSLSSLPDSKPCCRALFPMIISFDFSIIYLTFNSWPFRPFGHKKKQPPNLMIASHLQYSVSIPMTLHILYISLVLLPGNIQTHLYIHIHKLFHFHIFRFRIPIQNNLFFGSIRPDHSRVWHQSVLA